MASLMSNPIVTHLGMLVLLNQVPLLDQEFFLGISLIILVYLSNVLVINIKILEKFKTKSTSI